MPLAIWNLFTSLFCWFLVTEGLEKAGILKGGKSK